MTTGGGGSRAYLDHASTSPLRPQARDALVDALDLVAADPGRVHEEGLTARAALEAAREQVAALVGARSREVVFTSGATEAIVAATWGGAARAIERNGSAGHQVVSAVEHSAVRRAAERSGPVTVVPVDGHGLIDADQMVAAITDETSMVHIQWANHEVGTLQPVAEVVTACRERQVLAHVDAASAVGRVAVAFDDLGADLMSVSGHKLGGPAGTGALLVRRGLRIPPLMVGGDQERARRAGLEPVAQLVALGAAAAALAEPGDDGRPRWETEADQARRLTDRIRTILDAIDGTVAYGHPRLRLPHLVCAGIEGVEPQGVILGLDRAGVAAHSGSSCASESLEPSPVLEAMGVDAHHSLRLSVGWSTTDAHIDRLAEALPRVVSDLRGLAARY